MEHVYLSRRNLLILLSKLDRKAAGEETACAIIKNDNKHEKYPQTMDQIKVVAVEDDEYYASRRAGHMHPADEAKANIKCTACQDFGLVEGLDTYGGSPTFETCQSCITLDIKHDYDE